MKNTNILKPTSPCRRPGSSPPAAWWPPRLRVCSGPQETDRRRALVLQPEARALRPLPEHAVHHQDGQHGAQPLGTTFSSTHRAPASTHTPSAHAPAPLLTPFRGRPRVSGREIFNTRSRRPPARTSGMKIMFEFSRRARAPCIDGPALKDSHAPAHSFHPYRPSFRLACATEVRQAARAR